MGFVHILAQAVFGFLPAELVKSLLKVVATAMLLLHVGN